MVKAKFRVVKPKLRVVKMKLRVVKLKSRVVMEFEISARMNFLHNLERRKTECVYF